MNKRLQLALMAIVIATSLSFTTPCVQAEASSGNITASVDDSGRKVYVNDSVAAPPVKRRLAPTARQRSLVYWSASERRWKPVRTVPGATLKAARTAAAEVNQYLDSPQTGGQMRYAVRTAFTQAQIDAAIQQAAARHNVDPNLVRAVVKVESNFNPNAVSRKGAMGLMQLMPQTARQLKVENPFDPEQNVDAGVRHLKRLMESYGGDVRLSLAAYNAGAGAVARSAGIPRYAETRNYVRRITQLYLGGSVSGRQLFGSVAPDPVRMQRDERGVLYISNTD
ncbi:MAG TPA: lytic transglycosylase domain-containing protein [Terriglobales bacterium]